MQPFSAWAGPKHPKLLFVGEAWGAEEEKQQAPLVGPTGRTLWRMIGQALKAEDDPTWKAGLSWNHARDRALFMAQRSFSYTNVFNLRPANNDMFALCTDDKKEAIADYPPLVKNPRTGFLHKRFGAHLLRLQEELELSDPNIIVCLGAVSLWAIKKTLGISELRGTIMEHGRTKLLPTYHPAATFRQPSWYPIVVQDIIKAFRHSAYIGFKRPDRTITISPTIEEWEQWCCFAVANKTTVACDTETSFGMIDTVGFACSPYNAIVCQIGPHAKRVGDRVEITYPPGCSKENPSYFPPHEEVRFWRAVREVLTKCPLVFQNGYYDLQYLWRIGLRPNPKLSDTMLKHHALYPEMQKGLGFLSSLYTDEVAHKMLRLGKGDTEKRDE